MNDAAPHQRLAATRRALLLGNFAIGCGVMVAPGALNDLARALSAPVAAAGQVITVAAFAMALGAPLLAALLGRWDRRRLLVFALAWYGIGHTLCALMPNLALLVPVRAACVLGAAVFTPQAAAAIGVLAPPAERGRAITGVFLGWSIASVLGMPVTAFIAETLGWRAAFGAVALLALAAAWAVWRALPDGIYPEPTTLASFGRVATNPLLVLLVGVTALSSAGQFTLFSYMAPYYVRVLGASAAQVSLLFLWFGVFGLAGNLLVARWIDRTGPGRAVTFTIALMALSLAAWPWAGGPVTMALVLVPWALGCFASNSAQQARLAAAAPTLAPLLLALNTSAMYAGQALGAGGGGALLARSGFGALAPAGLAWLLAATLLSAALTARLQRSVRG